MSDKDSSDESSLHDRLLRYEELINRLNETLESMPTEGDLEAVRLEAGGAAAAVRDLNEAWEEFAGPHDGELADITIDATTLAKALEKTQRLWANYKGPTDADLVQFRADAEAAAKAIARISEGEK